MNVVCLCVLSLVLVAIANLTIVELEILSDMSPQKALRTTSQALPLLPLHVW